MPRFFWLLPRLIIPAVLIALISAGPAGSAEQWNPVKGRPLVKISSEGYGNCIFSNQEIVKGREAEATLKAVFEKPEQVFARCFFHGPLGPLEAADFWHELWVDGEAVKKTAFQESPGADWDQTQIWISSEDYAREMNSLSPGRRVITILVLKNQRSESGKILWTPAKLAKGEFIYNVK